MPVERACCHERTLADGGLAGFAAGQRGRGAKREVLVLWEGYSNEEATWEPATNLKENLVLKEYNKRMAPRRKAAKRAAPAASGC